MGYGGLVTHLAWRPDSRQIASLGALDKLIRVFDVADDRMVFEVTKAGPNDVSNALEYSVDGRHLISASVIAYYQHNETATSILDAETGAIVNHIASPIVDGHGVFLSQIAQDPKGVWIAERFGSIPARTIVYDARTWKPIWTLPTGELPNHQFEPGTLFPEVIQANPRGGELALAGTVVPPVRGQRSNEIVIDLWNVESDKTVRKVQFTPRDSYAQLRDIAYSPDGLWIASALDNTSEDHISVWDARTGARRWTSNTRFRSVHGFDWSPDGRFIASASNDHRVRIFDAATGTLLDRADIGGDSYALAFSPGGKLLAYGSGGYITIRSINAR